MQIKMKAYQAKLPDTIPVVKPAEAEAMSIEGPTLVPHIEKPMWYQRSEFSAKKSELPFLRCVLAQTPMASRMTKYPIRIPQSSPCR